MLTVEEARVELFRYVTEEIDYSFSIEEKLRFVYSIYDPAGYLRDINEKYDTVSYGIVLDDLDRYAKVNRNTNRKEEVLDAKVRLLRAIYGYLEGSYFRDELIAFFTSKYDPYEYLEYLTEEDGTLSYVTLRYGFGGIEEYVF